MKTHLNERKYPLIKKEIVESGKKTELDLMYIYYLDFFFIFIDFTKTNETITIILVIIKIV